MSDAFSISIEYTAIFFSNFSQLTTLNYQLSTINYQLTTNNYQLTIFQTLQQSIFFFRLKSYILSSTTDIEVFNKQRFLSTLLFKTLRRKRLHPTFSPNFIIIITKNKKNEQS
jgi:hypothetical protein